MNVLAAGTDLNPTVYMELWVDGVREAGFGSTNTMRTTLNLTPGAHKFVFYAIDAAGIKFSKWGDRDCAITEAAAGWRSRKIRPKHG